MGERLVRIRFQELSKDVIARAWITSCNSVVICVDPGTTPEQRKSAVRQALCMLRDSENDETPEAVRIISQPDSGVIVNDELN